MTKNEQNPGELVLNFTTHVYIAPAVSLNNLPSALIRTEN